MNENDEVPYEAPLGIDDKYLPIDEHIEYVANKDGEKVGHRGIYLLPNLLTTAAMFCGFYAILSAIAGKYEPAAIAIFSAMFFDALDGRVARLVNAQSAFGVEYDSLSDMLSFGLAPAIVAFNFGLAQLGKLGWSIAFLYVVCASLRLARFNTQTDSAPSQFFSGLASPAAAALLTSYIWLLNSQQIMLGEESYVLLIGLAVICLTAGLLMISNFSYYSFKDINMKGRVSFIFLLLVIFFALLVTIDPPLFLFLFATGYIVSGLVYTIYQRFFSDKVQGEIDSE